MAQLDETNLSSTIRQLGRRQKLLAAGVIVALALLSIQTYSLVAGTAKEGLSTIGIGDANGSTATTTGTATTISTSSTPSLGGSKNNSSTLTVTGNGQVQVAPNTAILTIGVTSQGPTAGDAAQQNANTMTAVISALEGIGISNNSISTSSYSVYSQTAVESTGNLPPKITGYEVDNEVQVTINAANQSIGQLGLKVGQAIDVAVSHGANDVYGVQFTATGDILKQANSQALILAVQDASSQARIVAGALGVNITGIQSVDVNPNSSTVPVNFESLTAQSAAASTPILPPQSLTVSAAVQVVYSIR